MEYIKSPLNYTGNKYRILPQISKYFPGNIKVMVDLFCGGATVGLNIECEEVYFVDSNKRVIDLLRFLSKQKFDSFLARIEKIIDKFGLSNSYRNTYAFYRKQCKDINDNNGLKDYNSDGYYNLRAYYNSLNNKSSNEANEILYVLMIYSFNNDIRFSNEGNFNLPIGKTDLNRLNVNKIRAYIERCKQIKAHFVCARYNDSKIKQIINEADFIYMDPPYLITDAVYNVNWDEKSEKALLTFIDWLIDSNKHIALSNVISKVGKDNKPLIDWFNSRKNILDMKKIEYNYRSSSYNKKNRAANEQEILIINRETICVK